MSFEYKEPIQESEIIDESKMEFAEPKEEFGLEPSLRNSSDSDVDQRPARNVKRTSRRGCVHSTPYKISRVIRRMESLCPNGKPPSELSKKDACRKIAREYSTN